MDFSSYGRFGTGHSLEQTQLLLLLQTEPPEDKATQAGNQSQGHPKKQGLVKNENTNGACSQSYLCTVHLHTSKPVNFPFLFKQFRLKVLSFATEISPPDRLL